MNKEKLGELLQGKYKLFLLDLSWFLHRNYNTFKWMGIDINGYKRPTGHIYGTLLTVTTLKKKFKDCVIIVCEDGVPVSRQAIASDADIAYKNGRAELEFNFYKDLPVIKSAVALLDDVYWAYNEDKESDDIMYALAKQAEEISDSRIYIYSGDNDLLQAISDRIKVVRQVDKKTGDLIEIDREIVMTEQKFKNKFHGVEPKKLPLFRAIVGDSSDNIKGIYRFPRALAAEIAMSSNSFNSMFEFIGVTKNEIKYCKMLREEREKVLANYKIMKLQANFDVKVRNFSVNKEKALDTFKKLQLNRFLKEIEEG